jgi:hypothetical protein
MPKLLARLGTVSLVGALAFSLSGCSATSLFGAAPVAAPVVTATPTPTATVLPYESVFSDMGSIHPEVALASKLNLQLDMWTEQKTHEWYPTSEKLFSMVISVFDTNVAESAPFSKKRKVYMSNLSVTATTTTTSGLVEKPFVLDVDPIEVTLDPEALTSDYGLLITSPKGGFQLESNEIGALAADTTGLVLDFAMTISTQSKSGSKSYATQVVHQLIPVAIFQPGSE